MQSETSEAYATLGQVSDLTSIVSAFTCLLTSLVEGLLEHDVLSPDDVLRRLEIILSEHRAEPVACAVLQPLLESARERILAKRPRETLRL